MIPAKVYKMTRLQFRDFLRVNRYEEVSIEGYTQILDTAHALIQAFPYTEEEIRMVVNMLVKKFKAPRDRLTEAFQLFAACLPEPTGGIPEDYEPSAKNVFTIVRR